MPTRQATDPLPDTATAASYQGTFAGRADKATRFRREIAGYLGDCPATADIVLIAH